MKFAVQTLLIALIICSNYQCKKNKSQIEENTVEATPNKVYDNYLPIKKGNYWIYENFTIDENGVMKTGTIDSCFYDKDSIVRNKTFHVLIKENMFTKFTFLTDSLDCIIEATTGIVFSTVNFSDILKTAYAIDWVNPNDPSSGKDTIFMSQLKMCGKDSIVTSPAGSFKTINAKISYSTFTKHIATGQPKVKYSNVIFCKDIGLIYEEYPYAANAVRVGRRLIRYHLN